MMRGVSIATVLFVGVGVPHFLYASVYISEVAWMGGSENANAEWIELYNNGADVDLTGWTLTAEDGQPSIQLSGVLGANSYALLERSSDDTVPRVPAFLVYTGALGNTGELLELRDESGVVVDKVDGRDNWSVGGSNDTKETLQRSGNPPIGEWTTGAPSPTGSAPATSFGVVESSTQNKSDTTGVSVLTGSVPKKEQKVRIDPALVVDIGENKTVFVGSEVSFLARAYKESEKEIVIEDVVWNFGDGTTGKGREVAHRFWYEGEYIVTAVGRRSGFLHEIRDEDSVIVRVVAPNVIIEHADREYVALKNIGSEIIDISKSVLISGVQHFRIPDGTKLLPRATVRFGNKITGLNIVGGTVRLYDDMGVLYSEYGTTPHVLGASEVKSASTAPLPQPTASTQKTENVEGEVSSTQALAPYRYPEVIATANAQESVETRGMGQKDAPFWWWIFGLITAIVTTIIAVLLVRRGQEEVLEGFYIEEEKHNT